MWYWRAENFQGLREIALRTGEDPELKGFRDYCVFREQGLRREAFAALATFITSTKLWTVDKQRDFIHWLIETSLANPKVFDLIPHPLQKFLVEPTIEQWQTEVPTDPVPFRLGGNRESLKIAVGLDPLHQETILRLLKMLFGRISMACHELPAGIIGETNEVLADLEEAEVLLPLLVHPNVRNAFAERLSQYREVAQNYASYLDDRRRGGSHADCFEIWATSRRLKCTVS